MNLQEYKHLPAERVSLQGMLDEIPLGSVLDRAGLESESRLETVEQELARVVALRRDPARATLTFRGRPVVGQHGIIAEFEATATSAFTNAVAQVAAGLSGPLAAMGPIPIEDRFFPFNRFSGHCGNTQHGP